MTLAVHLSFWQSSSERSGPLHLTRANSHQLPNESVERFESACVASTLNALVSGDNVYPYAGRDNRCIKPDLAVAQFVALLGGEHRIHLPPGAKRQVEHLLPQI